MTIAEARKIIREYYELNNPSSDDKFLYTEALDFMIHATKEPRYMMELGGHYYEEKRFDLAAGYYEMAAEYDYENAYECLGYIWYYGRTGERDFKKAFYYYSKAAEKGNIVCEYKLADMYRNGYYVEKDEAKYREIIENLYPKVKAARSLGEPLPEIFTRLARIRTSEGNTKEAVSLYFKAKDFLAQRIRYNAFFGNLNIMKWLIEDLYQLIPIEDSWIDLYDLYYLLKQPVHISFEYKGSVQNVKAVMEDDAIAICFNEKWFRTVDDFFAKAEIEGVRLTSIYDELDYFEIEED